MKKGFTLSEVLITLGIIGVVAALTIPSVMQNYKKQRVVSQLKKVYTVLNQAIKFSESDNGPIENWSIIGDDLTPKDFAEKYFTPYLKIIKTCNNPYLCYGSNPLRVDSISGIVLSDGSYIWFRKKHSDEIIVIDVNGKAGPNIFAKDIFFFRINNGGLVPLGGSCSIQDKDGCAAKIMKNSWRIPDDYPFNF